MTTPPATGSLLEALVETADVPEYPLPDGLRRRYGGRFGLRSPCLYSNFVVSVDGVVALSPEQPHAGSEISGRNEGDRFVMGLLRACADAVLVGAGTLRATPSHEWIAEQVYPDAASEFQELRRRLGRPAQPHLYVITARGDLDANHPALHHDATVITTEAAAPRLRKVLSSAVAVRRLGGVGGVVIEDALDLIRADSHQAVLTEGGPTLFGRLLQAHAVDEIFLTISPRLFGRSSDVHRLGLIERCSWPASEAARLRLVSVHRQSAHLFLHYSRSRDR